MAEYRTETMDGQTVHYLQNDEIQIRINTRGAELRSLMDRNTGREYMWQADPAFWGRTSPVLFPVVGSYRDGESRYNGEIYKLPQHGFARDMDFMLTRQEDEEIWFCLTDKENTWDSYPFAFALELGYRLKSRSVEVLWKVTNPAEQDMYFSIGGHPAFQVAPREADRTTCYLRFDGAEEITSRMIRGGLATDQVQKYELTEGLLPVTEELFENDALVIEENQTHRVELLDEGKKPFLTVEFGAPLFGVWTPPHKNAPFICIEPWYGRCDREDFTGSIEEREWGNHLASGEVFEAAYTIRV